MNKTQKYYSENAKSYSDRTADIPMDKLYEVFLSKIEAGSTILDAGCGPGRDLLYFTQAGFKVEAFDICPEMVQLASKFTGLPVQLSSFEQMEMVQRYDGIWASASLLHIEKEQLPEILKRFSKALKDGGVAYCSFKHGEFEGERNGRYFSDLTKESFSQIISEFTELKIEQCWTSKSVAPQESNGWLNLILRKANLAR